MMDSFPSSTPIEITVLMSVKGRSPCLDPITAHMSRSEHFCVLHYLVRDKRAHLL